MKKQAKLHLQRAFHGVQHFFGFKPLLSAPAQKARELVNSKYSGSKKVKVRGYILRNLGQNFGGHRVSLIGGPSKIKIRDHGYFDNKKLRSFSTAFFGKSLKRTKKWCADQLSIPEAEMSPEILQTFVLLHEYGHEIRRPRNFIDLLFIGKGEKERESNEFAIKFMNENWKELFGKEKPKS
ncbi:MAG TPA: hypothetical protein VJG83_00055 [archaeon]|nr:hypothetical protein [archaeon]